LARFTSTKVINTRWRNNDFVGAAGSSHTFSDPLYDEFLVDWALQIADGSIVITETPTTGNIQMATLTVGDIVLTGTATGNFGGSTIVGTTPISVVTASGTSTVSINQALISAAAATSALNLRTLVRNATASTIAKGSVVYLSSSNGTIPTVEKALATSDATSARTFGLVETDIASNSNGYVLNQGIFDPIDTSGIADGAVLWLSATVAGAYSTIKPTGPNHGVLVGICVKGTSVGSGSIYVFIKNGAELDEIHDVNISSVTNGQALIYNSAQSVWVNQSINTAVASISGTAPITTSGTTAVTVAINQASTSASGVVQLSDSVSTTSSVLAATPTAVKTVQDTLNSTNDSLSNLGAYVDVVQANANNRIPLSTVTTKGDLIVASASAAVARLGVGTNGQILTADSSATNGIKWATIAAGGVASVSGTAPITTSGTTAVTVAINQGSTSAAGVLQLTDSTSSTSTTTAATPKNVKTAYDIATAGWEAFMFGASGVIATAPRFNLSQSNTPTSKDLYHTRIIPHRDFTVSNISFVSTSRAAATVTLIRFGIYTRSGTTFTLVARTASDTTIFAATNTKYTRALDTTGGYPATYTMTAGAEYWVSVLQVATTTAIILQANTRIATAANTATGGQTYYQSNQNDLPSSSTGTLFTAVGGDYAELS